MKQFKIVLIAFLATGFTAFAQREISSPLTKIGYGEFSNMSYVHSQMGGIGNSVQTPNLINGINPASSIVFPKETFLFEVGTGYTYRKAQMQSNSVELHKMGLEYFAMGFAFVPSKWATTLALRPFTSVGFNISQTDTLLDVKHNYKGVGGMNQFQWSNSFAIYKGLSVGFSASYLFGSTNTTSTLEFIDSTYTLVTVKEQEITNKGFLFDFGFQYKLDLNDKKSIIIGATYRDKQAITFSQNNSVQSANRVYNEFDETEFYDVYEDTLEITKPFTNTKTTIAQQLSFGIGYEIKDMLQFGIDAGYQNWDRTWVYEKDFSHYKNKSFIQLGVSYTPNHRSLKYFKRLPYRVGFQMADLPYEYEQNGIVYKPKNIGISFGTDLQLKQTKNSINVSCEMGKRADFAAENGLEESYVVGKLKINLQENWFYKQKID